MNKQSNKTQRSDAVLGLIKTRSSEGKINEQPMEKPAAMSASAERPANEVPRTRHVSPRPDSGKQKRQKILAMSLRNISGAIGMLTSTRSLAWSYLKDSPLGIDDAADKEVREAMATLDAAVRDLQAAESAIRANNTVVKLLNEQEAEQLKLQKAQAAAADKQAKIAQALSARRTPFPRASYGSEDQQDKEPYNGPQFTVKSPLR
jgi:hypothetical protein